MSVSEELERLARLRKKGVITDAEFEKQKASVLAGGGSVDPGPMPATHLTGAILSTLFCCLPFGIVAIVKATQVSSLWQMGNYEASAQASMEAEKWIKITVLLGLVFAFLYVIAAVAAK